MSLFHNHTKSAFGFDAPEEGGDGLNDMIANERREGEFDLFAPQTGEELELYLDQALTIGGIALTDSHEQEA